MRSAPPVYMTVPGNWNKLPNTFSPSKMNLRNRKCSVYYTVTV